MITKQGRTRAVARVLGVAAVAVGALAVGPGGAQGASATPLACTSVGHAAGTVDAFTLYDNTGYSGSCITFYRYGSCTASTTDTEGLYNLSGWGWDNRASSVHTAHQCDVRLFDARDCPSTGTRSTWIDQSADLRLGGVNWQNRATCLVTS
jgi:hypothetical protein